MLALLAAGAGCDASAPDANHASRGLDRPAVRVLHASITTSYASDDLPVHSVLTEGGADATNGVALSASIRIFFDRFLLPEKVIRQSLCVHPTTTEINSLAECLDPAQPFTEVAYNPALRMVTYRLNGSVRLQPSTRYRISIFATADIEEFGFFAFDGAPLAQKYIFDFVTQPTGGADVEELLPRPASYCAAVKCFAGCSDNACKVSCRKHCVDHELALVADGEQPPCFMEGDMVRGNPPKLFESCGETQCHRAGAPLSDSPDPSTIAMGLDLFTRDGIELTALGKVAHQTQFGQQSQVADESPQHFGRAMPLIDAGKPGNSYLMYKILANPLNHYRPDGSLGEFASEVGRLRDAVVVGLPMPAQVGSLPPSGLLAGDVDPDGRGSFARALLINAWIANGAVLSCE